MEEIVTLGRGRVWAAQDTGRRKVGWEERLGEGEQGWEMGKVERGRRGGGWGWGKGWWDGEKGKEGEWETGDRRVGVIKRVKDKGTGKGLGLGEGLVGWAKGTVNGGREEWDGGKCCWDWKGRKGVKELEKGL